MKLTRAVNLVISIETDAGRVFVHSTPISWEVYETFFLVLSKSFASLFSEGLREIAGPSAAYLTLKSIAKERKEWDSVQSGLINEIIRLSNVSMPGAQGWSMLPLHTAFERKLFTEDDRRNIEGQLVFFTLMSRVGSREVSAAFQNAANSLWGSELTALSFTEWQNSLPTLTLPAISGATANMSSVPV